MLRFRKATEADAGVLAAMEAEYIECPWSERVILLTLADELSVIYVLCDDENVIGYGGLKMALDTAEVYNIVVDAAHRRKGYGTLILEKLFEHAIEKGASEMFLEVNENNAAALGLYTAHGFKISHLRKSYYKSGNALILRREM